jgi:hypothetical protein
MQQGRNQREGIDLLEYQAMPSLHDGWLRTCTIYQKLEISSARSWEAPVSATDTVRKRQALRPVHHVQNRTCRVTLLQPARRPPCWASHLAFGLIGRNHPPSHNLTSFFFYARRRQLYLVHICTVLHYVVRETEKCLYSRFLLKFNKSSAVIKLESVTLT